jgi:hypothetical protein
VSIQKAFDSLEAFRKQAEGEIKKAKDAVKEMEKKKEPT